MISIPKDIANIIGRYCEPTIFSIKFNTKNKEGHFHIPQIITRKYFIAECENDVAEWMYNNRNIHPWIHTCYDYWSSPSYVSIDYDKQLFIKSMSQVIERSNNDVFVVN